MANTQNTSGIIYDFNDLTSSPTSMWAFPGKMLAVPVGSHAVIAHPDGRRDILGAGIHNLANCTGWTPRLIQVQYVSAMTRTTQVGPVSAHCRDGFVGEITIKVNWRVSDPLRILETRTAWLQEVTNLAEASVRAVIESMPHDVLFGGDGSPKMDANGVTQLIAARLCASKDLDGLEVISVTLMHRQGDTARVEAQAQRARLEQEQALKMLQAQNLAAEEEFLLPLRAQRIKLRLQEAMIQQRFELARELIPAYAGVLKDAFQMYDTMSIASRRRPEAAGVDTGAVLSEHLRYLRGVVDMLGEQAEAGEVHPFGSDDQNEGRAYAA